MKTYRELCMMKKISKQFGGRYKGKNYFVVTCGKLQNVIIRYKSRYSKSTIQQSVKKEARVALRCVPNQCVLEHFDRDFLTHKIFVPGQGVPER